MAASFATIKYWAGQKLLHSPFHPLYLTLTGRHPKPQTYDEYLRHEPRLEAARPLDAGKYRLALASGATASPEAAHLLQLAAERTGADFVYADEDCLDADGRRHSPVFRPQWSPLLRASCDYIGGCFLERIEKTGGGYAHVPRILFHRPMPAPTWTSCEVRVRPRHAPVDAIICSRNPELLCSCLEALQSTPDLHPITVLHMGQGKDGDLRAVAARHGATAIEYSGPFHFGRMCNLAAKSANGEFLLLLNDDVTPLCDNWLASMVSHAADPSEAAALVGALLYFPDGRIQHAGVMTGTPNGAGHPGRLGAGASPLWPWLTMTREVSAVTGACMLISRDVFWKLGGFDESFPMNYNDVDLCLRARQAGYRVVLDARARLRHAESATRKTGIRYGERQTFLSRWAGVLAKPDPYFNPNLTDNELLLPDPEAFHRAERRPEW